MTVVYALVLCCVPACLLWVCHHQMWAQKLGIIALCYIAGLLLGNLGWLPETMAPVQQTLSDVTILVALPLLLFTLDVRQWRVLAGKALLSMLFATTSVVTLATCLFFIFRGQGSDSAAHFAAMSVGVYTGGTPNLAAIKTGLDIPHSEYIVFHSLDTVLGAAYLLFMLTLGVRMFRRLLGHARVGVAPGSEDVQHYSEDNYADLLLPVHRREIAAVLALAGLVVLAALGIAEIQALAVAGETNPAVVIVALTSLGIGLSLVSRVRQMRVAYKLGMYLIYVFCFVIASMASVEQLAQVDGAVTLFLLGTVFGSLLLHALLCRLARVDGDTFMVTSVAAVCSPPFVPMVARALDNPSALLSGMTAGIIGYALGNYLGISLGVFLQGL